MARMFERIAALKLDGCGLIFGEPEIMNQVISISSGMIISSSQKIKIKGKSYEGMIVTDFQFGMVGSLGGIQFDLSLDTNNGPVSLKFVLTRPVREDELRSMFWFGHSEEIDGEDILDMMEEYFQTQGYSSEASQH